MMMVPHQLPEKPHRLEIPDLEVDPDIALMKMQKELRLPTVLPRLIVGRPNVDTLVVEVFLVNVRVFTRMIAPRQTIRRISKMT